MKHIQNFMLTDNGKAKASVLGTVSISNDWINIGINGFKSASGNDIIGLELYEGRLILRIWDDAKEEDTTHVIDLSNAINTPEEKNVEKCRINDTEKNANALPFKDQAHCEAALQKFLWTRHTLAEIEHIFSESSQEKIHLQGIEEPFVGEDECFHFCMGNDDDMSLDMDLYVFPTNDKKDNEVVYLITAIKSSYWNFLATNLLKIIKLRIKMKRILLVIIFTTLSAQAENISKVKSSNAFNGYINTTINSDINCSNYSKNEDMIFLSPISVKKISKKEKYQYMKKFKENEKENRKVIIHNHNVFLCWQRNYFDNILQIMKIKKMKNER